MKNLIDELHKLDNETYHVSEDFSKRVMKQIKKDDRKNKFGYVISLASAGMVACLAFVLFQNNNVKNNFAESAVNSDKNTTLAMYDTLKPSTASIDLENNKLTYDDSFGFDKNYTTESDKSSVDGVNEFVAKNNSVEALNRAESISGVATTAENTEIDFEKIKEKLENKGYKVEKLEYGLKVKATKDAIEKELEGENVKIEVQNEYVIIK